MLRSVFTKTLRDVRRAFAWWSVGLCLYVALIVAIWPTVRDNPAIADLHESYPEALQAFVSFGGAFDFGTPAGYLGAELFSLMVPLLLLVAAIGAGARALAGEEERGTLELLLSVPLPRTRIALEKLAALAAEVAGLALVLLLSMVVGALVIGMDVSASGLASATVSALVLALTYGTIAFAIGAATGRGAVAIGLSAAAAVAAYLVNGLAPLVEAIHSVRWLSPWYHYVAGDPLRDGLSAGHVTVLVVIATVAAIAGVAAFSRRDVGVSS